jgi:hypothetical protein
VRANAAGGSGGVSGEYSTVTNSNLFAVRPNVKPITPTGLLATPLFESVRLNWARSLTGTAVASYIINNNYSDFTFANVNNIQEYTATDLTNGVIYPFRIKSVAEGVSGSTVSGVQGDFTSVSANATAVPNAQPTVPQIIDVIPGNGEVYLRWSQPDGGQPDVDSYVITVRPEGGNSYEEIIGNVENTIVSGLTNAGVYSFQIRARALGGRGGRSSNDSVVSSAVRPNLYPPTPTEVTAVAGDNIVALSWFIVSNSGNYSSVQYYKIDVYDVSIEYTVATIITPNNDTVYNVQSPNVANNITYTFRITAIAEGVIGSTVPGVLSQSYGESDAVTPEASGISGLQPVTNVSATFFDGYFVVYWKRATSGQGPESFIIEGDNDFNNGDTISVSENEAGGTVPGSFASYTIPLTIMSNAVAGTPYTFNVRAAADSGDLSDPAVSTNFVSIAVNSGEGGG